MSTDFSNHGSHGNARERIINPGDRGLTLAEMIVMMMIAVVLILLLVLVIRRPRDTRGCPGCAQVGAAIQAYLQSNGFYPFTEQSADSGAHE